MATLPDIKQSSSDPSYKPKLREVSLGDGYTLRSPDGLNHIRETHKLKWEGISRADRDTLMNFLERHGGYTPFDWTPFGETESRKWVCKAWGARRSSQGGVLYTVTATFTEDFAP